MRTIPTIIAPGPTAIRILKSRKSFWNPGKPSPGIPIMITGAQFGRSSKSQMVTGIVMKAMNITPGAIAAQFAQDADVCCRVYLRPQSVLFR